jgi:hypothetical protein
MCSNTAFFFDLAAEFIGAGGLKLGACIIVFFSFYGIWDGWVLATYLLLQTADC